MMIQELRRCAATSRNMYTWFRISVQVGRSPRSKAAWKKCDKGGGSRRRMCLERNAAVVGELSQREQEEAEGARPSEASNGLERSTPVILYPKQYAVDVARIRREVDKENNGVTKRSQLDNLVAVHANASERESMIAVASVDTTIAKRQATPRAACKRKKSHKGVVAARMRDYAFQNCTTDTLSDLEGSFPVLSNRILCYLK